MPNGVIISHDCDVTGYSVTDSVTGSVTDSVTGSAIEEVPESD